MTRTRRVLASLAVATTTTAMLTGCFSDSIPDEWTVTDSLRQIPLVSEFSNGRPLFAAADVDAAIAQAGLERGEAADVEALDSWLVPLTGGRDGAAVYISPPEELVVSLIQSREIAGFDMADVRSFATMSMPPFRFASLTGDITLDTLPGETFEVADGVVSDSENDDNTTDLANAGDMFNRIGAPTRFTAKDGRFVFTSSTQAATAWLSGDGDTLADDAAYVAVATALDAGDVVSAMIVPPSEGGMYPAGFELPDVYTAMPSFDLVGIGWSAVDEEPLVRVVYHLTDPVDEAATEALRDAWTDGVFLRYGRPIAESFDVLDATSDDSTVTVELQPTSNAGASLVYSLLANAEAVFTSD